MGQVTLAQVVEVVTLAASATEAQALTEALVLAAGVEALPSAYIPLTEEATAVSVGVAKYVLVGASLLLISGCQGFHRSESGVLYCIGLCALAVQNLNYEGEMKDERTE